MVKKIKIAKASATPIQRAVAAREVACSFAGGWRRA
jgi:hypothetical protein